MSYLKDIPNVTCDTFGCKARATKELVNRYNAVVSRHCSRHAEAELRKRQSMETYTA
jgi:hypothetical protein